MQSIDTIGVMGTGVFVLLLLLFMYDTLITVSSEIHLVCLPAVSRNAYLFYPTRYLCDACFDILHATTSAPFLLKQDEGFWTLLDDVSPLEACCN